MKALILLILPWHLLTFEDFKGKQTDPNSIAITHSGGEEETNCIGNKCTFTVRTVFYADDSYAVTRDTIVLIHEQGHLNIAEIWTRKLRNALKKYQGCSVAESVKAENLCRHYGKLRDEIQDQYDRETNHSLNHERQIFWNKWIAEQLKN
jgi:hypothetical protein